MHLPVDVPASSGEARLEILDAANRLVRRFDLLAGAMRQSRVDWDGTNDHGAHCAPGVYRACLVAGDTRQTVRIARVP
jgi:flagellar hook assembly protein FlgD